MIISCDKVFSRCFFFVLFRTVVRRSATTMRPVVEEAIVYAGGDVDRVPRNFISKQAKRLYNKGDIGRNDTTRRTYRLSVNNRHHSFRKHFQSLKFYLPKPVRFKRLTNIG